MKNDNNKYKSIFDFISLHEDESFSCENILILLGAGASRDAEIPDLYKILQEVQSSLIKYKEDEELKLKEATEEYERLGIENHIFKYLMPSKRGIDEANSMLDLFMYFKAKCNSSQYSLSSKSNIENILALINDIISVKEKNSLYNVIGEWEKELIEGSRNNFNILRKLRDKITSEIIKCLHIKDNEPGKLPIEERLKYLNFIFYLKRKAQGNLNIFTLNHDLALETAYACYLNEADESFELFDGLETGFNDQFSKNSFGKYQYDYGDNDKTFSIDNFSNRKNIIKVFKLHGSINWVKNTQREVELNNPQAETNKHEPNEITFGISQKYRSEEPYSTLYQQFKNKLKENQLKLIIVVGYSFNDQHINDAIASALTTNQNLKICISDPSVAETLFFCHPELVHSDKLSQISIIKRVISSGSYESYLNLTETLYALFYSRNFDEDALFLAYSFEQMNVEPKSFIDYTKSPDGRQWLLRLFANDIKQNGFDLEFVSNNFDDVDVRNKAIYKRLFDGDSLDYINYLDNIEQVKVQLSTTLQALRKYKNANSFENLFLPFTRLSHKEIEKVDFELFEQCILELVEDLHVIEEFIKEFIPVHIYTIFFYIEQYNLTKSELKSDKSCLNANGINRSLRNLSICVLELFLKYNYFIDAIQIRLAETQDENYARYSEILTADYVLSFSQLLDSGYVNFKQPFTNHFIAGESLTYRTFCSDLNQFLVGIKNKLTNDDQRPQVIFDPTKIFALDDHGHDFVNGLDQGTKFLIKSVLHLQTPREKLMLSRVQLYSKALCKSLTDRNEHRKRLLLDLRQLIDVGVLNKTDFKRGLITKQEEIEIHIEKDAYSYFEAIPNFENAAKRELANRIDYNMNKYLRRSYRQLVSFIDLGWRLNFEKLEINQNLIKRLYSFQETPSSEESREITDLLNGQIFFRHFKAKLFFSKDFGLLNIFKFYNSIFYSKEYCENYDKINLNIKRFLDSFKDEG